MGDQVSDSVAPDALLAVLHSDPQYKDVMINCHGQRWFKVHRCIVGLQSPVLDKMIDAALEEQTSDQTMFEIKLTDDDDTVDGLSLMIEYMYHGDFIIDHTVPSPTEPCKHTRPLAVLSQVYKMAHIYELTYLEALVRTKLNQMVHSRCSEVLLAKAAYLPIEATSRDIAWKNLIHEVIWKHRVELEDLAQHTEYSS